MVGIGFMNVLCKFGSILVTIHIFIFNKNSHINAYFIGPLEIYSLLMNLSQRFLCSSSSGNLKTAHSSCSVKLEKHPLQEYLLTIFIILIAGHHRVIILNRGSMLRKRKRRKWCKFSRPECATSLVNGPRWGGLREKYDIVFCVPREH